MIHEYYSFGQIDGKCEFCRASTEENEDLLLVYDENGSLICDDCLAENHFKGYYNEEE